VVNETNLLCTPVTIETGSPGCEARYVVQSVQLFVNY